MRSRYHLPGLLIFGLLLIIQGCATPNYSVVTSPAASPKNQPVKKPAPPTKRANQGDINVDRLQPAQANVKPVKLLIVGNGTTLLIPPLGKPMAKATRINAPHHHTADSRPFVFEVLISPNETGVSFDPSAVTLDTGKGQTINASGLVNNAGGKIKAKAYSPFCKVPTSSDRTDNGRIPLMEGTDYCFRIGFDDASLNLEHHFKVNIKGVDIKGQSINVPIVEYEPKTGRFNET